MHCYGHKSIKEKKIKLTNYPIYLFNCSGKFTQSYIHWLGPDLYHNTYWIQIYTITHFISYNLLIALTSYGNQNGLG